MIRQHHDDDCAHNAAAIARLRVLRVQRGLKLADVAARLGTSDGACSDFEIRPRRHQIGSIQDHAYGIGYRVRFTIEGLAEIDTTVPDTLRATAGRAFAAGDWRRAHAYDRAALGALLRAHRNALDLTQQQLGDRLGQHKGNIQLIEAMEHDPQLLTVQAQVRAMGGALRIGFVLADPDEAAGRVHELLAELRSYAAFVGVRHRAVTPAGTLKGLHLEQVLAAVDELGGTAEVSQVWLLSTRHKVLGPWLPLEPAAAKEVRSGA